MDATPRRRLRWYQYSLRSLFALTVLVAIGGSWFAVKRQQKERERAAVKAIRELGGSAGYDYQFDASGMLKPGPTPHGPAWLRAWLGYDFFTHPVAVASFVEQTDGVFEHLRQLTNLRYLALNGSKITDAGLEQLKGLTQLTWLILSETQVTDAGLEHLNGLTKLELLGLDRTQVTDAGLEHLKGLTQLQELYLNDSKVTDTGLEHLKGLTRLKTLDITGTKVTDEGVKRLQEALPNCQIIR